MARKNTVYSTEQGRHCSGCGLPVPACTCRTPEAVSGDGVVRLHRKVKGRNGKPVTLISGLPLAAVELKSLAKELKNKCGGGGSIEGKDILIQGDKRDRLKEVLESKGYQVKLSGG